MRIEARIFEIITAFFFLSDVVYGLWSHGEPVGSAALTLTGGLTLIVGTYFRFVSRRVRMRPEDNTEAEISDGAGEMGFFSPGSYWPVGMALSASVLGFALAFDQWWMVAVGIALILGTVAGLVFEYHIGPKPE
ncbi:MAG: cytochrome c oxidase subunit 4 [Pseudonocardiales bacterium]|nr:cytochrome c oxidase subunit 4 [Pseudonocardiales bacterium]MBV9028826.1 cytochrome c oxidase subunit 4 [Pseudonocardiales bacterium]MBW0010979.1 cytochrome c oxidase subunit 4 [Pseudonocardiales bacterium]